MTNDFRLTPLDKQLPKIAMKSTKVQLGAGAILTQNGVILSFDQDEAALAAIDNGVAICDRSHWGVIKITGDDRLRYLHNQSTNDFESRQPGTGCDTVFVTSTARTLDLATTFITDTEVLVLISPNRIEEILTWLDRFIFPFDKVELANISSEITVLSIYGAKSDDLLTTLTTDKLSLANFGDHQLTTIAEATVRIAQGSGLLTPGYTILVEKTKAEAVWNTFVEQGAIPFGDRLWQQLRIQQGRPTPDQELTEDFNPLEAGLWQTISFEKGCYIGQETIARLNTYNGVKQKLWGLKLSQEVAPQTPITIEDRKVGVLTSYTNTSTGHYGLGYVKTKAGGEGLQVKVGEAQGELVAAPFLKHEQ